MGFKGILGNSSPTSFQPPRGFRSLRCRTLCAQNGPQGFQRRQKRLLVLRASKRGKHVGGVSKHCWTKHHRLGLLLGRKCKESTQKHHEESGNRGPSSPPPSPVKSLNKTKFCRHSSETSPRHNLFMLFCGGQKSSQAPLLECKWVDFDWLLLLDSQACYLTEILVG